MSASLCPQHEREGERSTGRADETCSEGRLICRRQDPRLREWDELVSITLRAIV